MLPFSNAQRKLNITGKRVGTEPLRQTSSYVLAVKDELILVFEITDVIILLTIPKQIRMKCRTNYQVPIRIKNNERDDVLYPQENREMVIEFNFSYSSTQINIYQSKMSKL